MSRNIPDKVIVVGVDFGTTYSGVSWAVDGGDRLVRTIQEWPFNNGTHDSEKVPTLISYGRGDSTWGFQADKNAQRWFKLGLDPNHEHAVNLPSVTGPGLASPPLGEEAKRATKNFLKKLWSYAVQKIKAHHSNAEQTCVLRAVLTVPAMWSAEAKQTTWDLAIEAGLPSDLEMVTEPEAAAIAAFQARVNGSVNFQEWDTFVVCDAGGGTVDLISYQVTSSNPLEVKQLARGTGGLCGASFIDRYFENFVRSIVGTDVYQNKVTDDSKSAMLKKFSDQIKMNFGPLPANSTENRKYYLDLPGVTPNENPAAMNDSIQIESDGIMTLFEIVCPEVVSLINGQRDKIKAKSRAARFKGVLLVGGFGANKYLRKRIEDAVEAIQMNENRGELNVWEVQNPWSAVSRGATLWGLQQLALKASDPTFFSRTGSPRLTGRVAPVSCGLRVLKQPSEENDKMVWLVRAGDNMPVGRKITQLIEEPVENFRWKDSRTSVNRIFSYEIWSCVHEDPPHYFKEEALSKLCEVKHKVSKVSSSSLKFWEEVEKKVKFNLEVSMISGEMFKFSVGSMWGWPKATTKVESY